MQNRSREGGPLAALASSKLHPGLPSLWKKNDSPCDSPSSCSRRSAGPALGSPSGPRGRGEMPLAHRELLEVLSAFPSPLHDSNMSEQGYAGIRWTPFVRRHARVWPGSECPDVTIVRGAEGQDHVSGERSQPCGSVRPLSRRESVSWPPSPSRTSMPSIGCEGRELHQPQNVFK